MSIMIMTAGSSDIERISNRRREIARETKDAKLLISALTSEDAELEIAERVVLRLSGKSAPDVSGAVTGYAPGVVVEPVIMGGPKQEVPTLKPPGTPKVPKMILEALRVAKLEGKSGLAPRQMTEYIAEKWWPEVGINNIGPIAWRMLKRGQLVKPSEHASVYALPTNETPDVAASGVSSDEGGT